jgi:thiamine-phosphate pyrophosphorylase
MLQFITNSKTVDGTIEQALQALSGGCKWVQVRMKDADDAAIEQVVTSLMPHINAAGATLIIDDKVDLVKRLGAHGVHLAQNDMPPAQAREILGPDKIIGCTVNNEQHAQNAVSAPIDYIGIGPWRFTTTKQKLAPVLGAEGITSIISYLRNAGVNVPIVAIGGIKVDDICNVMQTGATGIAISGEIATAANPVAQTKLFIETLKQYSK